MIIVPRHSAGFDHAAQSGGAAAVRYASPGKRVRAPLWQTRYGGVAEWLKAHAWKACLRETVTWVRIPLPPPELAGSFGANIVYVDFLQELDREIGRLRIYVVNDSAFRALMAAW